MEENKTENSLEEKSAESSRDSESSVVDEGSSRGETPKRAKHASDIPEYFEHDQKIKRNLKIAIVLLLVLILVVVGLFAFYFLKIQNVSVQQTQVNSGEVGKIENTDPSQNSQKSSTVPGLASLIGTKVDEVAQNIGHGAQVTSDEHRDSEEDPIKRVVKLTLTNDIGSGSSGNPTVTVNGDSEGNITSVTYQASIKTLGYGTMSFSDAVQNEKIIEKVLKEAGLSINSADVTLPEDKSSWTQYSEDGKRISREEKEFSGEADGKKWSAKLVYDYTVSLATDNLSDTLRNITITISS